MSNQKKKPSYLIILAFAVMIAAPYLVFPIIVCFIIYTLIKKHVNPTPAKKDLNFRYHVDMPKSTPKPTPKPAPEVPDEKDDSSIFCFHRDKAVHHLYQGKEVDPWDRPDTDISKYQRR